MEKQKKNSPIVVCLTSQTCGKSEAGRNVHDLTESTYPPAAVSRTIYINFALFMPGGWAPMIPPPIGTLPNE